MIQKSSGANFDFSSTRKKFAFVIAVYYQLLLRVDNSRSNTGFGVPKPLVFLTYAMKSSESE